MMSHPVWNNDHCLPREVNFLRTACSSTITGHSVHPESLTLQLEEREMNQSTLICLRNVRIHICIVSGSTLCSDTMINKYSSPLGHKLISHLFYLMLPHGVIKQTTYLVTKSNVLLPLQTMDGEAAAAHTLTDKTLPWL